MINLNYPDKLLDLRFKNTLINMKSLILFLLGLLFVATNAYSQSVDYNKIILPDNAKDISIEERLVQIAWRNNPMTAVAANNVSSGEYRLRRSQWSVLDHLRFQGNLNEFTIKGRDNDVNNRFNYFPRYNISLTFSLFDFVSTPLDNKIARKELENREEAVNQLKLQLRADVLRRYIHYKTSKELYDIQKEYFDDLSVKFDIDKRKFNSGEITLNEFNNSKDRFDNQRIKKITTNDGYLKAKLDLEELLGLKLEEIL